jgi:hypothetical protein
MKRFLIPILIVTFGLSFYAFRIVEIGASNVLQKLGIPEEIAKDCIWSSFSGGYLSQPGGEKIKQTVPRERGGIVNEIGEYAKAYARSEEFKKKYLEYRENRKPEPPEAPKSMAQQRQEQKEQLQKSIRETEANMKSLPADQQDMMKSVVQTLKDQLKSLDDPNNPMFNPEMDKMLQQSYAAQMEEHKKNLAKWEKEYPLTPNEMIKRWLTEFLEVSKDIDFNAKLVPGDGGKKRFEKPEYERKSSNWKLCFRAGKETVEAGRVFAKQWQEELNRAK